MTAGRFIVLEGPEGAGKSTLAAGLVRRFNETAVPCILVREPGGTPVAEAIRSALLDPERELDGEQELLYFTTARADLVARVIRPALEAGGVVLSDRFTLSTEAYQIGGRGVEADLVWQLNRIATGGLTADLTLVLDIAVATGAARQMAAGKRPDRMERASREFHERVAAWYLTAKGPGIRHLEASQSVDALLDEAWGAVVALTGVPIAKGD